LVEAVRHGYWVILDELNLAPSEVLEALNRLLDDNRELHIVETQKTIKAHPNFRIFATQNPTEGYGGRKELSEAFKNRFILIKVGDVPIDELQEILIQNCPPKEQSHLDGQNDGEPADLSITKQPILREGFNHHCQRSSQMGKPCES